MLYAAYGSNLHPMRLGARTPSARCIGTAQLPDWTLSFHKRSPDGSGKCNIVPGGSGVHVAVYELDDADKRVLDTIEDVGCGYRDELLEVPGFGRCAIYLAEADYIDDSLQPWCWYHELVRLGSVAQGFPAAYHASIEAVVALRDPDDVRRADNERLLAAMRTRA